MCEHCVPASVLEVHFPRDVIAFAQTKPVGIYLLLHVSGAFLAVDGAWGVGVSESTYGVKGRLVTPWSSMDDWVLPCRVSCARRGSPANVNAIAPGHDDP